MKRRDLFKGAMALAVVVLTPKVVTALVPDVAHPMRLVEVYRGGVWVRTAWPCVKQGDIFRMWEPNRDGLCTELVDAGTDLEVCLVTKPPQYVGGEQVWRLTVEPYSILTGDIIPG